jgi:hypothetical protein
MRKSGEDLDSLRLHRSSGRCFHTRRGEKIPLVSIDDRARGEKPMSKYQQIIELLSDGEWHTKEDLGQVTAFPELWLDELRLEPEIKLVDEDETVRVRLAAA